jgi:hypothetical protein
MSPIGNQSPSQSGNNMPAILLLLHKLEFFNFSTSDKREGLLAQAFLILAGHLTTREER